jgi:NAD(P)-dependent dehydrogenase (short-subunit alcohol dehydrogenase family)/acyl dehydratase
MGRFENRVVVITGAGGGLGRAHALAFAREGAKVVVNDLGSMRDGVGADVSMADSVVAEIKTMGGQAVANYDSVATQEGAEAVIATALEKFGRIDVLVNNAGILRDKTILKMTEDLWDSVLAVHLRGSFLCTQAAARAMIEQKGGGRIINTTSVSGLKGNFGQANYAAAKAGIYGLTLVGAIEFAKHGITVNAIAPIAKTRMTEDIGTISEGMTPEQVSPMVLFLASEEAAGVTGRIFGVHGNHLFEYKMITTEGAKSDTEWTVKAIHDALPKIESALKPAAAPAIFPAGDKRSPASVIPASDDAPIKISPELISKTFHGTPLVVRRNHAEAYAKATNDQNTVYFADDTGKPETPPLLAVRYHVELAKNVLFDPGIHVAVERLVHAGQEMIFHQSLRIGDVISPKAAVHAVEHKASGSLLAISYRLMCEGKLVNETLSRYFARKASTGGAKHKESPVPEIENPDFEVEVEVSAEQSRLYAEASLDHNPLHLDEGIARAAGFKGVILHGLCTLAFASQAVVSKVAGNDPTRLATINGRFSKPVYMGDRLITRGKVIGSDSELIQVQFEVVNQDHVMVLTNGLAEVRAKN